MYLVVSNYADFTLNFAFFSQKLKLKSQNSSKKLKVPEKTEAWFAGNGSKKQAWTNVLLFIVANSVGQIQDKEKGSWTTGFH